MFWRRSCCLASVSNITRCPWHSQKLLAGDHQTLWEWYEYDTTCGTTLGRSDDKKRNDLQGKTVISRRGTSFKGQGICLRRGVYPVPVGSPSRGGVSVHGANFLFDDFFHENDMKTKEIGPRYGPSAIRLSLLSSLWLNLPIENSKGVPCWQVFKLKKPGEQHRTLQQLIQ